MPTPSPGRSRTPRLTRYAHGITAIDADYVRPGLAAAHLIVHEGRAAFVDVGTNHSVPLLLAALDELALPRDAIDYLFLTHVHLDHAGGAGALLEALPAARAVLHPRGAPHLIAPEKLVVASKAVYGEEAYAALYGELVPIPEARAIVTSDGQRLSLGGRVLEVIHTPGHALHHQCFVDPEARAIFAGDTFGLSYRELDTPKGAFIVPTTTPSQFDPAQLAASLTRILSYQPEAVYLMHYGEVKDVPRLGATLLAEVRWLAALAERHASAGDPKAAFPAFVAEMSAHWLDLARQHGVTLPDAEVRSLLAGDVELNAQGLVAWLARQRKT